MADQVLRPASGDDDERLYPRGAEAWEVEDIQVDSFSSCSSSSSSMSSSSSSSRSSSSSSSTSSSSSSSSKSSSSSSRSSSSSSSSRSSSSSSSSLSSSSSSSSKSSSSSSSSNSSSSSSSSRSSSSSSSSFAASPWEYTEDFEAFNIGNLDGQDSWTKEAGSLGEPQIQNSVTFLSGKAGRVQVTAIGGQGVSRAVSEASNGAVFVALRINDVLAHFTYQCKLQHAGTSTYIQILFDCEDEQILLRNNDGTKAILSDTLQSDKWYCIGVEFDVRLGANGQFRANINDGEWSNWYEFSLDLNAAGLDEIYFNVYQVAPVGSPTLYFDEINTEQISSSSSSSSSSKSSSSSSSSMSSSSSSSSSRSSSSSSSSSSLSLSSSSSSSSLSSSSSSSSLSSSSSSSKSSSSSSSRSSSSSSSSSAVPYVREYGGNWQRKLWFTEPNYWRGRYDPDNDWLVFEWIDKDNLGGDNWAENENARIDCDGFTGIDADFTVRKASDGISTTIHYSDGVDSWIAESNEATATGWAWENLTKVHDGTTDEATYQQVNLAADRQNTNQLHATAVCHKGSNYYIVDKYQTKNNDITGWGAAVDISTDTNTTAIKGSSIRSIGAAGADKYDMIAVWKEGASLKSKWYDGDWDEAEQVIDAVAASNIAQFDLEHGENLGEQKAHIIYIDSDGTIKWTERTDGNNVAEDWTAPETIASGDHGHYGVGIIEHGTGHLYATWSADTYIEYRKHDCSDESWDPILVNDPAEYDSTTDAVVNTLVVRQLQTPDDIVITRDLLLCWIGDSGSDPSALGWGIFQALSSSSSCSSSRSSSSSSSSKSSSNSSSSSKSSSSSSSSKSSSSSSSSKSSSSKSSSSSSSSSWPSSSSKSSSSSSRSSSSSSLSSSSSSSSLSSSSSSSSKSSSSSSSSLSSSSSSSSKSSSSSSSSKSSSSSSSSLSSSSSSSSFSSSSSSSSKSSSSSSKSSSSSSSRSSSSCSSLSSESSSSSCSSRSSSLSSSSSSSKSSSSSSSRSSSSSSSKSSSSSSSESSSSSSSKSSSSSSSRSSSSSSSRSSSSSSSSSKSSSSSSSLSSSSSRSSSSSSSSSNSSSSSSHSSSSSSSFMVWPVVISLESNINSVVQLRSNINTVIQLESNINPVIQLKSKIKKIDYDE